MTKKVFISYSHAQGKWVWYQLVPCLRAAGIEVLVDRERFEAGKAVIGQMDDLQDSAGINLLVLSPEYLRSNYCIHEMDRAIKLDPKFKKGVVIPIIKARSSIPDRLKPALNINLCRESDPDQWNLLMQACGADLGINAVDWLRARDEVVAHWRKGDSVNLLVSGNPPWRALIDHLSLDYLKDFAVVDLDRGSTVSRRGLVSEILKACGVSGNVPSEPYDLDALDSALSNRSVSKVALVHFDNVAARAHYKLELFSSIGYLVKQRKLVVLVQSRAELATLLPKDRPDTTIIPIKTVVLRGRQK